MALADAEVSCKDERAEAHERCENNIKVRTKMLTVEEKEFYEGMVHTLKIKRFVSKVQVE